MKIKTIKENDNMEPVVGVKIKDQSNIEETPVEEIETPEVEEETTEVEEEKVIEDEEINIDPISPEDTEVVNKEDVEKEEKDDYKKIACARLYDDNGTTIYRFDIVYKEFTPDNGIVEFRNIVNNFDAARPNDKKEYKEFFAMFGIIKWNFATTVLPYDQNILAAVTKLESLINEHIKIAGIKKDKFIFRVDTVTD